MRGRWDPLLTGAALALAMASIIAMASASATLNPALAWRQLLWVLLGIAAHAGAAASNYRSWVGAGPWLYGLSLAVLALVPVAGTVRLGAARWLSLFGLSLQPSEMAKIALVLALAHVLGGQPRPLPGRAVWTSAGLAGVPLLMVFLQPDLGSATILGAIWLGMAWSAGIPGRLLGWLAGGLAACSPLGWHLLKNYQRDRLLAFINPHADPLGAGYTIIQSVIAIGSGQLWGKGWRAGTQNQLNFLPERHSDFIFSVIGEEWGWLGCLFVLGAFGVLLSRGLRIAALARDPQGRLAAAGITAWLGYQAIVNMGMVLGLLPVVGVPLPLVSYGGSSMVMVWLAVGLLQSIHRNMS